MSLRCPTCMHETNEITVCEYCSHDLHIQNTPHQLPVGTVLGNQYCLGAVLGQGGFGITYIAWDSVMEQRVAIKEYFPSGYAGRDTRNYAVTSYDTGKSQAFAYNKRRFLREAESLAKLWNIPQIVKVLRYFEENGTAYIAMEYVEGTNLRDYLRQLGRPMSMEETQAIISPIAEALILVHKSDLVHRDISPDNIMVLPDGSAKLLDFGAARYVENPDAEKEGNTSTQSILKHGFAPPEQYQNHGALGPWTDVYALCATMYFCMTGKVPPDAMTRLAEEDTLRWTDIPGLTAKQVAALSQGMSVITKKRTPSIQVLWSQLKPIPAASEKQPRQAAAQEPKSAPPSRKHRTPLFLGAAALLIAALTLTFFSGKSEPTSVVPEVTQMPVTEAAHPLSLAPSLDLEDVPMGHRQPIPILSDHTPQEIQWTSDNPQVAMVSEDGIVTAVSYGITKITGYFQDSTAVCNVWIYPAGNLECNYEENETGITITRYTGDLPAEVILPWKIDGKPVTRIGESFFHYCEDLVSVAIPDCVTTIDNWAFSGCTQLTQITIPASVSVISSDAFLNTPWLDAQTEEFVICGDGVLLKYNGTDSHIQIPDSVKMISSAFYDSAQITEITIPDSVLSIGINAFADCTGLTQVQIPESVHSIGSRAFYGCSNLSRVHIPESVSYIGFRAFNGTPWLDSQSEDFVICGDGVLLKYNGKDANVRIPDSVKMLSSAFEGCSTVIQVTIPDGVTAIERFCFDSCFRMTDISIPDSVTYIGPRAFQECSALTDIELPKNLICIEGGTFSGCSKLNHISIPDSVSRIRDYAFYQCPLLTSVTLSEGCVVEYDAFSKNCHVFRKD